MMMNYSFVPVVVTGYSKVDIFNTPKSEVLSGKQLDSIWHDYEWQSKPEEALPATTSWITALYQRFQQAFAFLIGQQPSLPSA